MEEQGKPAEKDEDADKTTHPKYWNWMVRARKWSKWWRKPRNHSQVKSFGEKGHTTLVDFFKNFTA